jgi:hypothetical protein
VGFISKNKSDDKTPTSQKLPYIGNFPGKGIDILVSA